MRLHELAPAPGSVRERKRVGRGISSGHGKTSGRGHKGQKARSGGVNKRGFEGGQTPFYKRIPKLWRFKNYPFKKEYVVINVDLLEERFEDGAEITPEILKEKGIVKQMKDGIKLLGRGEVTKKFIVKVHAVSQSAKEKIEKAGGTVEVIDNV